MNFSDIGRLAADPECQFFESGRSKTSFTLAIYSADRDENGKPKTVWLNCEAWANAEGRGIGQTIANYCQKGHQVYVIGQLKQDEWTDKDSGKKRREIKLNVQQVKLLQNKRQTEEKTEEYADENWADDPKPQKNAVLKQESAELYATTPNKSKTKAKAVAAAMAINELADGDLPGHLPMMDDIPF